MKVAIEGCCHGELDQIYATLKQLEERERMKVDLLLICGDFQAVRNTRDLESMAVPVKYRQMQTFHKYYSGEAVAPVLTIFIGGNHEAADHLWELPYGGWAAPNIYYLGYASVLTFGGLRFGGLSGIYKRQDYMKGHFEQPPFQQDTVRSFYHIREVDVFRLKQIQQPMDVFLSHDWPNGIAHHGNVDRLLSQKPFFRDDIQANNLGSAPAMELLTEMRPLYWFSAHLHVKFSAVVRHDQSTGGERQPAVTKFLALDKCLPRRNFLQVIDFPEAQGEKKLCYDAEWLCILRKTGTLDQCSRGYQHMPSKDLWQYQPLPHEIESLRDALDLTVPENFCQTVPVHAAGQRHPPPALAANPQSRTFCSKLGIPNIQNVSGGTAPHPVAAAATLPTAGTNNDEINLDDDDDAGDEGNVAGGGGSAQGRAALPSKAANTDEINLDDDDDADNADDGSDSGEVGGADGATVGDVSDHANPTAAAAQAAASTSSGSDDQCMDSGAGSTALPLPTLPPPSSAGSSGGGGMGVPGCSGRPGDAPPTCASSAATVPRRSALVLPPPAAASGGARSSTVSKSGAFDSAIDVNQLTDLFPLAQSSDDHIDESRGGSGPRVLKRRNFAMYATHDESDSDDDSCSPKQAKY